MITQYSTDNKPFTNISDLQATIKDLRRKLAQTNEQLQHESFIRQKKQIELETLRGKVAQEIKQYRQQLTNNTKKGEERQMATAQGIKMRQKIQQLTALRDELSSKVKMINEQLRVQKKGFEKQQALLQQKIEFQQIQIVELKNKNSQLNKSNQRYFEASHSNQNKSEGISVQKLQQLQGKHLIAVRQLQQQLQIKSNQFKEQMQGALKKHQQIELDLMLERSKSAEKEKSLSEEISLAGKNYQLLQIKLAEVTQEFNETLRKKESQYLQRIEILQGQLDKARDKGLQDLQESTQHSEDALAQLKKYAQLERNQLQKRLKEQTQKGGRKLKELQEDLMHQMNDQKQNYEATIAQMQQKMEVMQNQFKEHLQGLKCDYGIKMQRANNSSIEQKMQLTKKVALLQQQLELTRNNLSGQLSQRQRDYQDGLNRLKQTIKMQHDQQIAILNQRISEAQSKADVLKKTNKKVQESNLMLKSELDREKALNRQKEQTYSSRITQLQEKYSRQLKNNTRLIEQLNQQHSIQQRKLNEQIQRFRSVQMKTQEQRNKLECQHQQDKTSMMTKISYLQAKVKRSKDDHQDLLKKFQTTVKSLSSQTSKQQKQQNFDNTLKRLKDQYNQKIASKQQQITKERNQQQQKVARLQKQIKTLRDKVLLYEMRQSANKTPRYQQPEKAKMADQQRNAYEQKIREMQQFIGRQNREIIKMKESAYQEKSFDMSRGDWSRNYQDRSSVVQYEDRGPLEERRSNISNINLSRKQPVLNKSQLKGQRRHTNIEEGIRKWQPS